MPPSEKKNVRRGPLSGQKLRERAFDLLSRRDHSEFELRRKLLEKGAEKNELPDLFEQLRQFGYLNDERFAANFVRYRASKSWGRGRFKKELMQRGVSSEIIGSILSSAPELQSDKLTQKLRGIVRKELSRGKEERKIIAALLRKGFAAGQIRQVLSEISSESEMNHDDVLDELGFS